MTTQATTDQTSDRPAPFFIVGAARSGTTLLRLALTRNPEVAIPPESHFIPYLWSRRRAYGRRGRVERRDRFLADVKATLSIRGWDLDVADVERALPPSPSVASAVRAIFEAYATVHGKSIWGDKTPDYAHDIVLLHRLFPDARFVHLVRDGRNVALSLVDLARLHRNTTSGALVWRAAVRAADRQETRLPGDRYLEVRYEDFVTDPATTLKGLCAFIDLDYDEEMLVGDSIQAVAQIPESQRWMHRRALGSIQTNLRNWREDMSPVQLEEFEAIAAKELHRHGYEPGVPRVRARVRAIAWTRAALFLVGSARERWARKLRRRTRRAEARRAPL